MAFDQTTRNRLQSFVSKARAILSEEFTRQLQATYGLDPKQGTIAEIESLTHLDNYQLQTAHILRDTVQHYMTTTAAKNQKEQVKLVLERIVREQAFTVLNRLAALRMAEARGFLLESIGSGYSSKGFQLYQMLENGGHGETGDAYRNYLFGLFDEFSLDLAVLFDRFSVQGRLFPRETALLQLLEQINDYEIEPLWAEDETIGWIYQYFNSQEERKKMRSESSAPRNSRELAVRNQFFTPRYVVEFLTDNTLGRIWYEMTKGDTALADSCQYLVKRPNEVFLNSGESSPAEIESDLDETADAPTQQESLDKPVYIPHRPLKDPRTIRMLDPACGSMHFGLYAFDLFERIYLEAWQVEAEKGADALEREADLLPLHQAFGDLERFKQQIPKLIIEHNIHGVDIDPRAVQIAGLSLWQRAQRAWHEQGVQPNKRPTIVKSNIVCAEPMPGEQDLLKEFTSTLNPPALGQLVEVIFDKMTLAGEAGTLLKIEQEIESAVSKAREQWDKNRDSGTQDLFEAELLAAMPQQQLGFDLSGIDDETFWDDAEQLILQALQDYSEKATSASDEKRLFAEDAAKGFAFIDLCRKRFDVVLMNPPFGDATTKSKKYIVHHYEDCFYDVFGAFVKRGSYLLVNRGLLGAITSRTGFYLSRLEGWRRDIAFGNTQMRLMADLGLGVLDNAMVETAAYTLERDIGSEESIVRFFGLMDEDDKEFALLDAINSIDTNLTDTVHLASSTALSILPGAPLSYWATDDKRMIYSKYPSFSEVNGEIKQGLATGDDYRFLRSIWEVPINKMGVGSTWIPFAKGGEYQKYYYDLDLVVNWSEGAKVIYGLRTTQFPVLLTRNAHKYLYRKGLTYPQRTQKGFSVRQLPQNCIFGGKGPGIFPEDESELLYYLGMFNSDIAEELIQLLICFGSYNEGYVSRLPIPKVSNEDKRIISSATLILAGQQWSMGLSNEISPNFKNPYIGFLLTSKQEKTISLFLNQYFMYLYGLSDKPTSIPFSDINMSSRISHKKNVKLQDEVSFLLGIYFGRWEEKSLDLCIEIKGFDPFEEYSLMTSSQPGYGDILEVNYNVEGIFENIANKVGIEVESFRSKFSESSGDLNKLLSLPNAFFEYHLKKYSKSRRQSPIYWPLQTPSGSYTLWVYYHRLNTQTLYSCVNDFVEPKLALVTEDLNTLSNKSNRSSSEEKELTKLTDLQSELKDFRDELLRLAKFWKPNLNDGVQITAAPLWKLFQHTAWQKKLKQTWEELEEGEYDWAHLAASIWPDRVLRKCHQDRSLAIAHDVEDIFWQEIEVPIMRGKKPTGKTKLEWQPIPASDTELDNIVDVAKARLNKG